MIRRPDRRIRLPPDLADHVAFFLEEGYAPSGPELLDLALALGIREGEELPMDEVRETEWSFAELDPEGIIEIVLTHEFPGDGSPDRREVEGRISRGLEVLSARFEARGIFDLDGLLPKGTPRTQGEGGASGSEGSDGDDR